MSHERKTLFTLDIDYDPRITALTFPLLRHYAERMGARFHVIRERRFPDWPVVYEKLQIHRLAHEQENDWNVYIDADALVHPETVDFTTLLPKDTVAHNGADMAGVRWTYDRYFRRDGRHIGSCNWLTLASDWCVDLWEPLRDLSAAEAIANIRPTVNERNTVITADHLLDDYVLSRNIARYGLKFTTLLELQKQNQLSEANFFWHAYTIPVREKLVQMHEILKKWDVPASLLAQYRGPTVTTAGPMSREPLTHA